MPQPSVPCFLVADIGGTNTRVALTEGGKVRTDSIRRFRNDDYPGLEPILREYVSTQKSGSIAAACVAIAGPVRHGKGRLTNRDWNIDEALVAQASGAQTVAVLNDLQAQGHALNHVDAADLKLVKPGAPAPGNAAKLVVNLGTGFNASPVFMTPAGAYVSTSESGHANMPVRDARDVRLCQYIERQHGFAAIDDILSGRGLERVYAFLSREAGENRSARSASIMEGCGSRADPIAVETVEYFIRLSAMVMGNLALVQLPFGGIYLVGGLSSAIAPFLEQAGFNEAFRDKGRFAGFMDDFAVYVVQDDYAALKGMAAYLADQSDR